VHRFFVPDLLEDARSVTLSEDETHHLKHVLRLAIGASVILFDGKGGQWKGAVESVAGRRATIALDVAMAVTPEPPVRVTIAMGLLSGQDMDVVIRDATALGAAEIAPFVSAHITVSKSAWRAKGVERWERVAIASAKQAHRATVPIIRPVQAFEDLLAQPDGTKILCAEPARGLVTSPAFDLSSPPSAVVYIGPEGGWAEYEVHAALQAGARLMNLGPRRLRAQIAPTVALTALWTHWGWG
jgi:16S rRNA (uracil1498-N3)-methyltransferase